jgi:hypothetical protein
LENGNEIFRTSPGRGLIGSRPSEPVKPWKSDCACSLSITGQYHYTKEIEGWKGKAGNARSGILISGLQRVFFSKNKLNQHDDHLSSVVARFGQGHYNGPVTYTPLEPKGDTDD